GAGSARSPRPAGAGRGGCAVGAAQRRDPEGPVAAASVLRRDLMRRFNLKGEWLVPHPPNESAAPGRTITPEPMRMAEPGRVYRPTGESVQLREDQVTDEEMEAAREWLRHVEDGRI